MDDGAALVGGRWSSAILLLLLAVVELGVSASTREEWAEDFFSAVVEHLLDQEEGDPLLSLASDLQVLGRCSQTRAHTTSSA